MNGWLLILCALALIGLVIGMVRFRRFSSHQELLQERIRTSEAFLCLKPLLERCRTLRVERIILRPEGMTVTLFDPPGKTLRCDFEEHGLDDAAPEPLLALTRAAAEELPMLADNARYFFRVHRDGAGEDSRRWYEYMIQSAYKDAVLRERYDRMDT